MPTKLTYANRYGREIEDTLDEVGQYDDSDEESSYAPSVDSNDPSDFDYNSHSSSSDDDDNGSDDDNNLLEYNRNQY